MAYYVIEGLDGTGKSTLAKKLAKKLGGILTCHPGSTPVGKKLRQLIIKDPEIDLDGETEQILFLADGSDFIDKILRPALQENITVIADRCNAMSAYCYAVPRGVKPWFIKGLWNCLEVPTADHLILLSCSFETCVERCKKRNDDFCKIEARGLDYLKKVHDLYASIPEKGSNLNAMLCYGATPLVRQISVIDVSKSEEEVFEQALDILSRSV